MDCNCPDKTTGDQLKEAAALLKYMIDHNKHHADELYDVANMLDGEAKELVHGAVIQYEQANGKLEQAYAKLGVTVEGGEEHHHHHHHDHDHDHCHHHEDAEEPSCDGDCKHCE